MSKTPNKEPVAVPDALTAFKARRREIEQELAQVLQRSRELQQEAVELKGSPVSRNDFIAALVLKVAHLAEQGRERIRLVVEGGPSLRSMPSGVYLNPHQLSWRHVQEVLAGVSEFDRLAATLIAGSDPRSNSLSTVPIFDGVSMCMIFEDQIKAALKANLTAIEWPFEGATEGAARATRLIEVEAELVALQTKSESLADLLADAISG